MNESYLNHLFDELQVENCTTDEELKYRNNQLVDCVNADTDWNIKVPEGLSNDN